MSVILKAVVDSDIQPVTVPGVTLYSASDLGRIFDWADRSGYEIEWIEGVFYDPIAEVGQLSTAYICQRPRGVSLEEFRATCLETMDAMAAERRSDNMLPYVEIGVSPDSLLDGPMS